MKIKILKTFSYGPVSDPKKMIAGNVQEAPTDIEEGTLGKWIAMKWVEKVA